MPQNDDRLLRPLRDALLQQWPGGGNWVDMPMEALKAKGLAHDHVRLVGTGWLARMPKQSQMQLSALDNLTYQQHCFDRASAAAHAPRCIRILLPCTALPRGALIVDEIVGRDANLPHDLPLMARSLAALHALPLPAQSERAPLVNAGDPLLAMWKEVSAQASFLAAAKLDPSVAARLQLELAALHRLCQQAERPLQGLIAFDGHPGNFVVTNSSDGPKAMLVDLEKCRYSYPGFDLAHATLYTSTTWDQERQTTLSTADVLATYAAWQGGVGQTLAADAQRWHLPLRRAMWLWSLTWCAKWRVSSSAQAAQSHDGEDWSAQNLDPALAAHVRERVDHYLSAPALDWVLAEFEALAHHWATAA